MFDDIRAKVGSVANILDPSQVRLKISNLLKGGESSAVINSQPEVVVRTQSSSPPETDWRVKLSLANPGIFGGSEFMQLLQDRTGGIIFPYTPNITVQYLARYNEQVLTHSNYKQQFYEGSEVGAITISGQFTVQSIEEGQYLMAVIQILRSMTKMFYGNDALAGNPPPIVFLDGYGELYFPHVPCVIANFTQQLPDDVDYLEIPIGSSLSGEGSPSVRLPTVSQITVTLNPVYSRRNVYENFSLTEFSQGKLLRDRGGFM